MRKLLKIYFVLLIILFSASCTKKIYKRSLKYAPYDAIIVPGVPYHGKEWNDIMKMRVYWSYLLYKKGIAKHIIYSGGAVYSHYYEAVVMKLYAEKLGIPGKVIFTDTIAEHSTENLWYSYKLAQKQGFEKIALATDPIQTFMVFKFKTDNGLNVRSLPIIFKQVDTFMNIKSPLINSESAYKNNFIPIQKRESKFKQFMGTLGLNISAKDRKLGIE